MSYIWSILKPINLIPMIITTLWGTPKNIAKFGKKEQADIITIRTVRYKYLAFFGFKLIPIKRVVSVEQKPLYI